jgi:uncharacterized membrane protein
VTVDTPDDDLQQIKGALSDLTRRIYRIERAMGIDAPAGESSPVEPVSPPPRSSPKATAPSRPASQLRPVSPALPITPRVPEVRTNLESRIGSHWLNRIGIAALLIGVSYFLKYAFENNWIGPAGRVSIGLFAGLAVVIWSERFRNSGYKVFSYSLKAVGIGVLYLSIWAAFQVYALLPGSMAFIAMVAVTGATAAMALVQDAEILAAFALSGGFTTPILLSTGQNRELVLFSYVATLNIATLAILIFRPWHRLLVLSYVGTLILYVGWYTEFYKQYELGSTLCFATLFFIMYAIAPLVAQRPAGAQERFTIILLFLSLVNAGVYFLQSYLIVSEVSKAEMAWFALGLAAGYLLLAWLSRARVADRILSRKFQLLHLALAVGFITVAIPIRLDAHWITVGWLVESAALLWVADRIKSDFLNAFAAIALAMSIVRLILIDNFYSTQPILNSRMGVYALAIAVLGMVAWYASKRQDNAGRNAFVLSIVAMNVLALITLSREVSDYYVQQISELGPARRRWDPTHWSRLNAIEISRDFAYSALWMAYGAMLMVVGFWRKSAFVRWQALILIAATIVKVFVYDTSQLDRIYRILSFIGLGVLLLAISFVYQRDWLRLSKQKPE